MPKRPQTAAEHREWWEANTDVPYGECWCGCGQRTSLAKINNRSWHYVKGEPIRYLNHHGRTQKRVTKGQRFGRLVALEDGYKYRTKIRVHCDCGRDHSTRVEFLILGDTRSCGCLIGETRAANNVHHITHGHTRDDGTSSKRSPTYRTWSCLNSRCRYDYDISWRWYGGRPDDEGGPVKVCQRWRFGEPNAFANFVTDMGERPDGMVIDRIDGLMHYSCGSCNECLRNGWSMNTQWATQTQNIANRANYGRYGPRRTA